MKLEGMTINFLGDSITQGAGTSAPDKRYFEVLKEKFCPDGLHPNDLGNTVIAERLGNFMLSL